MHIIFITRKSKNHKIKSWYKYKIKDMKIVREEREVLRNTEIRPSPDYQRNANENNAARQISTHHTDK